MVNDRTQSAQVKKNNRAEEWLKNAVKDKHVRLIPFSEISKVKYNVAKGGSGTIHLGAWRNMHVAIKEQHNTNDLIKELKMHKQVHDSNYIVKFFGITKHPLTHDTCIVMQFAENGCLQDYLETQNVAISWLTKYRLAWEVASGLDFIHRENIFHTDLHSRNILIDTGGKALITDFGLSKSVNKTIYTTKAGLFGVVPYVAPERMQNPTITYTAKCDIYSLGVILWELSSCVIPFEAQLQDVMLAVNIIAGVREKTIPGTAVEYEMLYRRCWDGLPQNRPQMDIVLSELVELLAAEQINPRPAAARPRSPKPTRPLSSDSMVAPSLPFAYETEASQPPSLENTHHVGPGSPSRALTRQSLGKASMVGVPSVPIRQDRTGAARVSFHEPHPRDNSQINGKPPGPPPLDANNRNGAVKATPLAIKKVAATNAQAEAHAADAIESPILPNGQAVSETAKPQQPSNTTPEQGKDKELQQQQSKDQKQAVSSGVTATSSSDSDSKPAGSILELLPPLPEFHQLSFSPNSSGSNDGLSSTPAPPPPTSLFTPEPSLNKLPGDAALALSRGLPMGHVVSKLPQASVKNISTISPPPSGAPPPPPGAVAGHSNTPRVISPPHHRNAPRASKTISPPAGAPPPRSIPSPSLGPGVPRPPPGPPPTPTLGPASGIGAKPGLAGANGTTAAGSRNPVEPIQYTPSTSYSPGPGKNPKTGQPNGSNSPTNGNSEQSTSSPAASTNSDTTRPTPARQIPMCFPVVTPLSPPHWTRTPTPVTTEPPSTASRAPASSASSGSSPSSSAGSSPSGSPSSTSPSTTPSSVTESPTTNRRDFRPISYLTQKHTGLLDLVEKVDQQLQEQQQQQEQHQQQQQQQQQQPHIEPPPRRNGDNTYVPNPNNNIIPPSQLLMQRAQSPELIRWDNNILGSPSLRPSPLPENGNRIIRSPHLTPQNRPTSPAFALPNSSNRNNDRAGGLFAGDAKNWMRTLKNATRRDSEEDDARSVNDHREARPQLPSKDSSSSSTTTTTTGTSLSTSPSTPTSANGNGNGNGSTPSSLQPRVQANTFYSISDPYKEMNHDEPTDFFAAVTQSDLATIERMLKSFPHLIHDSNGFWPHPTPLLVAARSRRALETMKTLLQYGAALDRGDHNGTTVLHYVCEQYPNPVEAIQFLVRAGADPNSRDAKKRTPLIVLLQNTHLVSTKVLMEALRTLFKAGAQANVVEAQYQRSALHVAIMHYQPPAPIQQQQQQQQSNQGNGGPVMVAGGIQIGKDLAPVLELLLKRGADVNARDARKATPLHVLLERMDNEELVQMLLLYGADPGIRTNKRNALMIAAEHLRVMSAWFLLENDLLSSSPESIKRATELCSKADGPDKSAKPLLKNTLSDWQGKEGKQRRIQLAQDCVLRVQRTPDMKTIDQTAVALEFLESVGQPIHRASAVVGPGRGDLAVGGFGGAGSTVGGGGGYGVSSSNSAYGTGSGNQHYHNHHNVSPTTSSTSHR